MQCVVTKRFGGPDGREFQTGELVDASGWRNGAKLIAQRFMRLATDEEVRTAEEVEVELPKSRRRSRQN